MLRKLVFFFCLFTFLFMLFFDSSIVPIVISGVGLLFSLTSVWFDPGIITMSKDELIIDCLCNNMVKLQNKLSNSKKDNKELQIKIQQLETRAFNLQTELSKLKENAHRA